MFPQIFGKYVLEREIASGGMAHVYLATLRGAVGFQKRLVVKQIRPELASDQAFVERFIEEAKTTVGLNHPNIVPVYELGVEQGVYYIALEFCEGITLGDLLTQTGPLAADEGVYLGVEICRALDYAHRRAQVIHRDVTPRNVLIDEEGAVRLIDFGIAAPVRSDGEAEEAFGSPGHMPPEQLRGRVTPATDVFAAGALLLEAWSGRAPFRRATAKECHAAVLNERPPLASASHPSLTELDALVASAVLPDQAKRPQDAEEFGRPLRRFLRNFDRRDVEQRLGQRVRTARRYAAGSVASIPDLERPQHTGRIPTLPDGSTQTFAAHAEIEVWTRRLDGTAPEDSDVDQLLHEGRAEPNTPPMAARLGTGAGTGPVTSPSTRKIAAKLEPIDGPESTENPELSAAVDSGRRSAWPWAVALGLGLAVVGVLSLSPFGLQGPGAAGSGTAAIGTAPSAAGVVSAESVGIDGAPSATAASAGGSAAIPPATVSSGAAGAGATANAGQGPGPSHALGSVRIVGSGAPSAAPTPSALAASALNLTSVPPSRVSVGGRSRGTTPIIGLRLAPGSYSVVFTSPTLGESVPAQVTLSAGQSRTLHADFTGVTPRLIQR